MNNILNLFKKTENPLEKGGISEFGKNDDIRCPECQRVYDVKKLLNSLKVCPECGFHFRMSAKERLNMICVKSTFCEMFSNLESVDILNFPNYSEKLQTAKEKTGLNEAVICGEGMVSEKKCALFFMDSNFIMGSMGSVVGEKITRIFEYATANNLPVIGFCTSGGARMQEGIISLMQMAKVSAAIKLHSIENLYISVLTDPTTGGVAASFAMLGDIIISEPNVLFGFAGKKVIEQTTKKKLSKQFQTAEYVMESGFIDQIVKRGELRKYLITLLQLHEKCPRKDDCKNELEYN